MFAICIECTTGKLGPKNVTAFTTIIMIIGFANAYPFDHTVFPLMIMMNITTIIAIYTGMNTIVIGATINPANFIISS